MNNINKKDIKDYCNKYFNADFSDMLFDIEIKNNKIKVIRNNNTKSTYFSIITSYDINLKDFIIFTRKEKIKKIL